MAYMDELTTKYDRCIGSYRYHRAGYRCDGLYLEQVAQFPLLMLSISSTTYILYCLQSAYYVR